MAGRIPAILDDQQRSHLRKAVVARQPAYAPYSGYLVGAALLCGDGRSFAGCNVENASSGLSLCAERNAVAAAVAAGIRPGELALLALAAAPIASPGEDAGTFPLPCGACLQVLAEFAGPRLEILILSEHCTRRLTQDAHAEFSVEDVRLWTLGELLPHPFRR